MKSLHPESQLLQKRTEVLNKDYNKYVLLYLKALSHVSVSFSFSADSTGALTGIPLIILRSINFFFEKLSVIQNVKMIQNYVRCFSTVEYLVSYQLSQVLLSKLDFPFERV